MTYDVTSRDALKKAIAHAQAVERDFDSRNEHFFPAPTPEMRTRLAGLWAAIAAELREQSNPRR